MARLPTLAARVQTLAPRAGESGGGFKAGKTTTQRGYGWRWQKARAAFLSRPENVLCRMCKDEGKIGLATVVDHVIPHKGDPHLMWNEGNWQPLCKPHHDSTKQRMEARGEI